MKYVLIHWTATNETSVLTEECVRDKTMLKDFDKEGMVLFGKLGCKEPKGGWKAFLGRVKYVSERKRAVEEKEKEFIGECHGELSESQAFLPTSTHRTKKRKLLTSESDQSSDSGVPDRKAGDSKKKIATAKKAAQDKAFGSIIKRMSVESESEDDSDCHQDEMHCSETKNELRLRIKKLQKELTAEKDMVKQLQSANVMLQKNLPDILTRTCKEAISGSSTRPIIAHSSSPSSFKKCNSEIQMHNSATIAQRNMCSFKTIHPASPSIIQSCHSTAVQPQNIQAAHPHSPLLSRSPVSAPVEEAESDNIEDNDAEEQPGRTSSPGASLSPLSGFPGSLVFLHSTNSTPSVVALPTSTTIQGSRISDFWPKFKDNPKSFVDPVQMSEILHAKNERKMTMIMLSILFERKVLAVSSVTGKSKEGRPALDREKVELIISHVLKRFPTSSHSLIKAVMAQKCKDARNAAEDRKTKAENV